MARSLKTDIGSKVSVRLPGSKELTPAVVLETAYSYEGDYEQCKLKVLKDGVVYTYPKPVQSYKLRNRKEAIPELDD